jgi:hypothetical protein
MQEVEYATTFNKIDKEVFFVAPIYKHIEYTTPEKYRERITWYVAEYIF